MCILPLDGAIEFLYQAVCLCVIWGTEAQLNPQGFTRVEIHLEVNFENYSSRFVGMAWLRKAVWRCLSSARNNLTSAEPAPIKLSS